MFIIIITMYIIIYTFTICIYHIYLSIYLSIYIYIIVCTPPPPLSAGGEGVKPPTKFLKRDRGLDKTSTFRGGLVGERWVAFFRVGAIFT